MHPSLKIYHPSALDAIREDFTMETLAGDCRFTEGPVWSREGYYLFSDIPANTVYRIVPGKMKEPYIPFSGTGQPDAEDLNKEQPGSNGLAFTSGNVLLLAQHGSHQIAAFKEGSLQPFISEFKGRPFNSPNDLVVHPDGRIFFSDPPYGLKDGKLNPSRYQPIAGVYCWNKGTVSLVSDKYQYPNGVCLSPDLKLLYICSNKPFENFVSVHDAGTLEFRYILCHENGDGIKADKRGHLILCTKEGLLIIGHEGERLALISLPAVPANCCLGGDDGTELFVTAREYVFLIRGLIR
jgi:gluconolactonase